MIGHFLVKHRMGSTGLDGVYTPFARGTIYFSKGPPMIGAKLAASIGRQGILKQYEQILTGAFVRTIKSINGMGNIVKNRQMAETLCSDMGVAFLELVITPENSFSGWTPKKTFSFWVFFLGGQGSVEESQSRSVPSRR